MEELDDLLRRSFDLGGLAEEGDVEVVMNLDGLVGVLALAVVGDGARGGGEVKVGEGELHQCDAPADEPGRDVRLAPHEAGVRLDLLISVAEDLLRVLRSRAVDVEGRDVLVVARLSRAMDCRHIAQPTKLAPIKHLIFGFKRLVLFPPLKRFRKLRLCRRQVPSVCAEKLLQDDECCVGSWLACGGC